MADREIMLEAVQQNWETLCYAAAEVKADREIVSEAVKQNWEALQYAAAQIISDREMVVELAAINPKIVQAVALRGHRAAALAAVAHNGLALQYVTAELRGDREVVAAAVSQNPVALHHAAAPLREDEVLRKLAASHVQLAATERNPAPLARATCSDERACKRRRTDMEAVFEVAAHNAALERLA